MPPKKTKRRGGVRKPPDRKLHTHVAATADSDPSPADTSSPGGPSSPMDFPVVGIGASAGGLDALMRFFDALPADPGLAFVIVQHLEPTHESLTAELLSRHTTMAVAQVRDRVPVLPNHVYVIPPDKDLALREGRLHVTRPAARRGLRAPIDFFLRSLAEERQERAIGIILSGTGTDGTLGLKSIKGSGGMTMVQDPTTAQYDGMPRSAIGSGMVDCVLRIDEMPNALIRYAGHSYMNGTRPALAGADQPPGERDHLTDILGVLRARTKYDFRRYKRSMLARRVQRRMSLNHIEAPDEFLTLLRRNPGEAQALFKDLLIGVTAFFREPEAYKVLEEQVLRPLLATKDPEHPLRVWVPGCATGEEPYSLAMLLCEQVAVAPQACPIQIFASDIDGDALNVARAGIYPETIAANVPPERLKRFFVPEGPTYQIGKQLRESVVFAVQNLIGDPPFSRLDLISCRNLLIYLEADIQKKLVSLFHFALSPGGYLFLGSSETTGRGEHLFSVVSKKWRIYQRVGAARRYDVDFPLVADLGRSQGQDLAKPSAELMPSDAAQITQRVLLETCAPAAVLINHHYETLYFHGACGRYLNPPVGKPTADLLSLVQDGLRTKLRAAVHHATQAGRPTTLAGGRVERDGGRYAVRISAVPVPHHREGERMLLVTFEDEPQTEPATQAETSGADEQAVRQLEIELKATREDLQSTIEELETSNEELKASNEEIMSMNEELQSTNEELETSKEELQSLNEELITINNQLQEKVSELESTNNDLANLLSSTDIATIFLDAHYCIKRFTPATRALFNLIPSDLGRPMSDIACKFGTEDLAAEAEQVLKKLTPIEKEVQTDDGLWYLRRVLPYRTQDNRIEGVVVTFVDITQRKLAEQTLRALNETLEERVADRTATVNLLYEVATAANESHGLEEVLRVVLPRVAAHAGACFYDAFVPAGDEVDGLAPICWGSLSPDRFRTFADATQPTRLRQGEGLAGSVYATGQHIWAADAGVRLCERRAGVATELGLTTAAAFPVPVHEKIVAVIELFWDRPTAPNPRFFDTMTSIAIQLGRVVERGRARDELREQAGLLEAFFTHSVSPFALLDKHGRFNRVNEAYGRAWQRDVAEFPGHGYFEFSPDDTHPVFEEVLRTKRPLQVMARPLLTKHPDQGVTYWDSMLTPILAESGEVELLAFSPVDVTHRVAAEEKLRQTEQLAALGTFAAGVSHEINNPLSAILMTARHGLRLKQNPPEIKRILEEILEDGERCARIVGGVLRFARKRPSQKEPVSLVPVLHAACAQVQRHASEQQVRVELRLPAQLPLVSASATELEQVFVNLVRNAVQASRPRQTVLVDADPARTQVRIRVRDRGHGMDRNTCAHAFDPFFSTRAREGGTGLGLSVAHGIVTEHGGTIRIDSQPERGTTITVELPLSTPDDGGEAN